MRMSFPISSSQYGAQEVQLPQSFLILWDMGIIRQKNALDQSVTLIKKLVKNRTLGNSMIRLVAFDQEIRTNPPTLLTPQNVDDVINAIANSKVSEKSDFITAFSAVSGNQFDNIILITDGYTSSAEFLDYKFSVERLDVLAWIKENLSDKAIFPIGVGSKNEIGFFDAIIETTTVEDIWTQNARIPQKIIVSATPGYNGPYYNFVIRCKKSRNQEIATSYFLPQSYDFQVKYGDEISFGKIVVPGSFLRYESLIDQKLPDRIITNVVLLIILLLIVIILLVPLYNQIVFKRDFIRSYKAVREEGISHIDPLTMAPIQDGEKVVIVGKRMMQLSTWKYIRDNQNTGMIKDYQTFFDHQFQGSFFDQYRTRYRFYYWFWFGIAAGAMSWLLLELFYLDQFNLVHQLKTYFSWLTQGNVDLPLPSILIQAISLSFGLNLLVSIGIWRSKRGKLKIVKLVVQNILALLLFVLLFSVLHSTLQVFQPSQILAAAIFWICIGVASSTLLGYMLDHSMRKWLFNILWLAVLGFVIFYLLNQRVLVLELGMDYRLANLFAFLTYGVGTSLLMIEQKAGESVRGFEIISPEQHAGQIISLAGILDNSKRNHFFIGRSPSNLIFIDWPDPSLKARHAIVTIQGRQVFVEPNEGHVLINDAFVYKRKKLQLQDIISFGLKSMTRLRYQELENEIEFRQKPLGDGDGDGHNTTMRVLTPIDQQKDIRKQDQE